MTEYIQIQKMMKNINLTINGPKEVVKIVKFVKPTSSETHADAPNEWSVEKFQDKDNRSNYDKVLCEINTDSCLDAEAEATRSVLEKREKHQKLLKARQVARSRFYATTRKKTEAFQTVLALYTKDSIQSHAPYLGAEDDVEGKLLGKGRNHSRHTTIPKAFSAEDLDLTKDLPLDRSYLLAEEAYSFIDQYFPPKRTSFPGDKQKDLERELRTCYSIGHLDEIKKKQFGQMYTQTRKYYMDLERFEFLERQKASNISLESKRPLVQPKVVRFRP